MEYPANFFHDFVELIGTEMDRVSNDKAEAPSYHEKAYLAGKFAGLQHAVTLFRLASNDLK